MKRRVLYGIIVLLAFSPISPLFWKLANVYYEPKKQEAMRFCESLVPLVEAVKQKTGHYPEAIDPEWIKGKKLPALIRPNHFYASTSYGYILYFWNPGDFMDDYWHYDSRGRSWVNTDADKPKD